jgi:DNA polymerase-3 subunit alpha
MEFSKDDFSLIDEKTALEYFKDVPEAVGNTMKVADLCENYEIDLGNAYFPHFPLPDGITADEKLRELAYEGFPFRDLKQEKKYIDRLEYELSVIKQKGYAGYFLVVGDLLQYAHDNGILTNIRGSVAGSLTTYLIGITNVDPLVYKLPFERFLNPERPSLPDIDMDYADNRRGDMIEYAKKKYGEDHVAQIGTFGTMMAKGSVRDVARALGYPYAIGDRLSTMIPLGSQGFPMTIDRAMEIVPELAEAYKKEPDTKRIIDLAKKMEGCVRHVSVHAAGVVIAPKPLYEYAPTQYDPKGDAIITQYDMHYIEDVGLPKFDFLGIRNLAILADAVKLVETLRGIKIDLDRIPLDDPKTFAMLARGET